MTAGKKRKLNRKALFIWGIVLIVLICIFSLLAHLPRLTQGVLYRPAVSDTDTSVALHRTIEEWPDLDVQLLEINPYSRVGISMDTVNGVVVHYTANPGATAQQNRDYFANLATEQTTKVSSHFVIGLEGEIIQCIPCDEIAYASNDRNSDTIAIECCIADESGEFNESTYESLIELTAWLVCRYDLAVDDVIRHYDVTGKNCPKDFVENPEKWDMFKNNIQEYILEHGT